MLTVHAQNSSIPNTAQPIATAAPTTVSTTTVGQLTDTYPADGSAPVAKPEWLELIKNTKITDAPVLKSEGSNGNNSHINLLF